MSGSATLDPGFPLDNSYVPSTLLIGLFLLTLDRMGAMMIGVIVSAVLHGITLLQAFIYWMSTLEELYSQRCRFLTFFIEYKKDAWYLKSVVRVLLSVVP